ncbi:MAG: N-6 DNA methylase [Planctomycetota bacterium]
MQWTREKQNGVHYTPAPLAQFLAQQVIPHVTPERSLRILDPACGDGELLCAIAPELEKTGVRYSFTAFDMDADAVAATRRRLKLSDASAVTAKTVDFIQYAQERVRPSFDCVISNPPYVRTQVLGGKKARQIAEQFGLNGRIDLYQAFTIGMTRLIKPGGVLGLLTSNRFLSVKSGTAMREMLSREFDIKEVFDLGDSKLFEAAILPVVVIAVKKSCSGGIADFQTSFHRVSRESDRPAETQQQAQKNRSRTRQALLNAVARRNKRVVSCDGERFRIEHGSLMIGDTGVWSLSSPARDRWLRRLRKKQFCTFGDVCTIKVGIKTTADNVFVRKDWSELDARLRPERKLIRPLITHQIAGRWSAECDPEKHVLYPYKLKSDVRATVKPGEFPRAFRYLRKHRQQLSSRQYIANSNREWFEIWVPHQPVDWAGLKIVWPDISVEPKFFLDESGAIVGGDSYWIKLNSGVSEDWLYLMLGVANSTIATEFYDTVFHNKLYAGRRRFMTQYVKEFPLPDLESAEARSIVRTVKKLVKKRTKALEERLESAVQAAFGFSPRAETRRDK